MAAVRMPQWARLPNALWGSLAQLPQPKEAALRLLRLCSLTARMHNRLQLQLATILPSPMVETLCKRNSEPDT